MLPLVEPSIRCREIPRWRSSGVPQSLRKHVVEVPQCISSRAMGTDTQFEMLECTGQRCCLIFQCESRILSGVQMISLPRYWRVALSAVLLFAGCRKSGPPYSAADALTTFKVESGFHVENVLAEPDVISPAAMDIDENGRMYVVEDRGYPLSTDVPLGRIKMIEDTNGDGVPDRVTIF